MLQLELADYGDGLLTMQHGTKLTCVLDHGGWVPGL